MTEGLFKIAAVICISFMTGSSQAAQTWNAADDFSTRNNPSGQWTYGVIGGRFGSGFVPHPEYGYHSWGADYWYTPTYGETSTARGLIFHNPSLTNDLNLTGIWGSNIVLRANEVALHTSMFKITDMQTLRFTAPSASRYSITITFSGITYNNIFDTPVSIALNGAEIFADTINGFVGSTTFGIPASGSKPVTSCSETLFLAAGDTVDIIKANTGNEDPTTSNAVGVDATVILAQMYPDLNNDGIVDMLDLVKLSLQWLEPSASYDLNNDDVVNFEDFAIVAAYWGGS